MSSPLPLGSHTLWRGEDMDERLPLHFGAPGQAREDALLNKHIQTEPPPIRLSPMFIITMQMAMTSNCCYNYTVSAFPVRPEKKVRLARRLAAPGVRETARAEISVSTG